MIKQLNINFRIDQNYFTLIDMLNDSFWEICNNKIRKMVDNKIRKNIRDISDIHIPVIDNFKILYRFSSNDDVEPYLMYYYGYNNGIKIT